MNRREYEIPPPDISRRERKRLLRAVKKDRKRAEKGRPSRRRHSMYIEIDPDAAPHDDGYRKIAGVTYGNRQAHLAHLIAAGAGESHLTNPEGRDLRRNRWLEPEPDNPHDPHAVAVYIGGEHVGYLPKNKPVPRQPTATRFTYEIYGGHEKSYGAAIRWPEDTPTMERNSKAAQDAHRRRMKQRRRQK